MTTNELKLLLFIAIGILTPTVRGEMRKACIKNHYGVVNLCADCWTDMDPKCE